MRRVEVGPATRNVTIEDCVAVDNTGAFANIEDSATQRTARRSSLQKKKRVGNIQKERISSVLADIWKRHRVKSSEDPMQYYVKHVIALNKDDILKWECRIKEQAYKVDSMWDYWDYNGRFTRFHEI